MKTNQLIIQAVAYWRKYGFAYVRDLLWDLRYMNKITDKQLLQCFKVIHEKE